MIPPDALARDGLDVAPTFAELTAEAQTAAAADPVARHELAYLTPELIAGAAEWRRNVEESARRAGFDSIAEYFDVVDPVSDRRATEAATPMYRTLADVSDDPPRPLLFGILEPDGPTLAYAAPGVGKGTTGAWMICEAQRAGMLPLVYDAERRPREWARRVSGLGGDRSHVVYLEPEDLPVAYRGKPLWESAPAIGSVVKAAGADLLIVDSIMPAVGLGEERLRSDAQVPYLWVAALDALGIPSLSFGHPPKGMPEGEPFGSFAWVAAMRLTWLGTRAEGDEHRVRWRPKKRNERGHIPGVLLTFSYGVDGRPCSADRADDDESTRDWILAALVGGPLGVRELAEAMLAEHDDPGPGEVERIKERIGRALYRMARDGWVEKRGKKGPGVQWALRVRP